MTREPVGRYMRHLIALFVLLALFAQMLSAATHLSATVDEAFHVTSGLEYLRTGRLHLFDEHAPLAKALIAWPLIFVPDLQPPETASGYAEGDLIVVAQETTLAYRPLDRVIVSPRVAAAMLALLLAVTIYRVSTSLAGSKAGLPAMLLCAFDPNFIAHGSLATTDMGATAFCFWAVWSGALWVEQPTRRRWWAAGLLLGLAQGVKLTALLIYPVLGIGVLVSAGRSALGTAVKRGDRSGPDQHPPVWRVLGGPLLSYLGMVAVSFIVLWALYGFEFRPVAGALGGLVPVPAASHVERWFRLEENLVYGRESFLLGQNGMHGWLLYFPVAFVVKTPLALLLFSVWAAGMWIRARIMALAGAARSLVSARGLTLVLFPVVYGLASLTSHLNIGYRHLLPVLPFLYVGVAGCLAPFLGAGLTNNPLNPGLILRRRLNVARLAVVGLFIWMAVGTLAVTPHYLAFFNELAGGTDNGWRLLADSNTDWGQTFKELARYQKERDLRPVRLSAFTFYDPEAYGVIYEPIAPMSEVPAVLPQRFNPPSGVYAISATTLDGIPLADPATFDWFRHREPFSRMGHVMFLYDVQPLTGSWIAQCDTPVAPLSTDAIDEGLGISGLRNIVFDCEQSWVLPGGGTTPGWYARAIPEQTQLRWPSEDVQGIRLLPEWLAKIELRGISLSYVQPRNGALPAFALWECDDCGLGEPERPVCLDGVIAFLGMSAPSVVKAGTVAEVTTFWRILASPGRPISLKMHLSGNEGSPIVVGDGLGYSVEHWRAGDLLIQRHMLPTGEALPRGEYTLSAGAYWLDTLVLLGTETLTVQLRVD